MATSEKEMILCQVVPLTLPGLLKGNLQNEILFHAHGKLLLGRWNMGQLSLEDFHGENNMQDTYKKQTSMIEYNKYDLGDLQKKSNSVLLSL